MMTSYILSNGSATVYPYSPAQLRADNPGTSFPSDMPDARLAEWNVYPVTPTPQPAHNPETQRLTEGTPEQVAGAWVQVWTVTDLTPEEIEARIIEWRQGMAVSPLQMRRALRVEDLMDAVTAYVAAQDADTQDAWEYAVEIRRDDALIAAAGAAMGKTDSEIDDLFRLAATL
jgi:hypothetical protein